MYRFIASLFLLLPLTVVAEQVRYVTDNLTIPMRTGTTLQHKILKMIPSGTAVEVLEGDSDNSRVRVQGVEGWVLTRFLDNNPIARDRLNLDEQKIATLELENTRLKSELKEMNDQRGQTDNTVQKLREDNQHIQTDLNNLRQTAANAIEIDKQNRRYKTQLLELDRTIQSLRQENAVLRDRTARDWFMAGAMVALTTLVVSLFLPKMVNWRRRSQWKTL